MKDSAGAVDLQNIHFSYALGSQQVAALRGLDLSVAPGDFLGVLGPSGSGKTTLLNIIGLIESPQVGRYQWRGQDVTTLSNIERNTIRRFQMGYIFQSFNLFPTLSAYENVEFFLTRQGLSLGERKERVEWALNAVEIWAHRTKKPLEMSGGQRQRVAIARALAKRPQFIIADEPTASLDQQTGRKIMEVLARMNQDIRCTLIISSHDPMVHGYLKRTIHIQDGVVANAH